TAWRFYTALDGTLPSPAATPAPLAAADVPSSRFIEATRHWWRASGGEAEARQRRTGSINFEVALLEDGNICH
ncbi:MAG: ABC transporter substrate-binding protein, partial [Rhizobacter sp.]